MAYSNQIGEARGNITGGLIPTDNTPSPDYGPLDHDQRNTLNMGAQTTLPWQTFISGNIYYGSGFTNGEGPDHLPGHTTLDLALGKNFGEKFSVSVTALNAANRRFLLDNSETFGGTHYFNPREIFVQIRYKFRY